ncbi:hypothetical protein FQA39_LY13989 [Lamprigera yunnana]|nr:hypothetical protein FQA39_LY13989 [Lamprigera yunnana]
MSCNDHYFSVVEEYERFIRKFSATSKKKQFSSLTMLTVTRRLRSGSKMWMAYAERGCTKAVDLRTVVERLHDQFSALEFDAEHEAVYGLEKGHSVIECSELQVKYETGVKLCDQFLQGLYSASCLIVHLKRPD